MTKAWGFDLSKLRLPRSLQSLAMTERPVNLCCGVLQHAPTSLRNTIYDIRYTRDDIREKEGCKDHGVKQKK